jgi:hypothetical protein
MDSCLYPFDYIKSRGPALKEYETQEVTNHSSRTNPFVPLSRICLDSVLLQRLRRACFLIIDSYSCREYRLFLHLEQSVVPLNT